MDVSFTLSGDSQHTYVVDESGGIVASYSETPSAEALAEMLNDGTKAEALLTEARQYLRPGVGASYLAELVERIDGFLSGTDQ